MAASPSSKSAAYEQGVREGSAMAKKKAGKRSMEMEPGEGKAHEAAESPAEEAAEGPEPDDAPRARRRSRPTPSRQRSAKNAANTKAPMDSSCGGKKSMDGEGSCGCGAKKGAKCSCDGEGCGSSMKRRRSDALTAPEYLAACELGIQDRPRSYIRARLDAAERLDLKCGKGSISRGEKCHKGPTSQKQAETQLLTKGSIAKGWQVRKQNWSERFSQDLRNGFTTSVKTGAIMGATSGAISGGLAAGIPGAVGGSAAGALIGGVMGTVAAPLGAGISATAGPPTGVLERTKSSKRKTKDSVYAKGFTADLGNL